MLRASAEANGEQANLKGVTEGADALTGVAYGEELLNFAESGAGHNLQAIAQAREALAQSMGDAAMVDAAGVIANFQRMVRIADGTGIPLDAPVMLLTDDIREELGLNDYGSADRTPLPGRIQQFFARLIRPIGMMLIRYRGRQLRR